MPDSIRPYQEILENCGAYDFRHTLSNFFSSDRKIHSLEFKFEGYPCGVLFQYENNPNQYPQTVAFNSRPMSFTLSMHQLKPTSELFAICIQYALEHRRMALELRVQVEEMVQKHSPPGTDLGVLCREGQLQWSGGVIFIFDQSLDKVMTGCSLGTTNRYEYLWKDDKLIAINNSGSSFLIMDVQNLKNFSKLMKGNGWRTYKNSDDIYPLIYSSLLT